MLMQAEVSNSTSAAPRAHTDVRYGHSVRTCGKNRRTAPRTAPRTGGQPYGKGVCLLDCGIVRLSMGPSTCRRYDRVYGPCVYGYTIRHMFGHLASAGIGLRDARDKWMLGR